MKVLLIGWDTAEWSIIQSLLERGWLPRLRSLLSQGLSGDLQPVRPFDTAALWTSVVTGKRAMAHGVLSSIEVDASRTCIRPTLSWTRTAKTLWSILSDAGYRAHAFGWPASHPAEPINGVSISDGFADGRKDSVHPPRLLETLHALRLAPTDIDAASLLTLLPRAAELNPIADQRLHVLAEFLASTGSLHAAATWVLEHEPWDFAAVRYAGLARLINVFGRAYAAAHGFSLVNGTNRTGDASAGCSACDQQENADLFGGLIPNAYRFYDMILGRLLELAGPDTSVMLVSQHGWDPRSSAAKRESSRARPGILIAAGPAFRTRRSWPPTSVCDVAPTNLGLFGVPPEKGSDGRDVLSRSTVATGGSTSRSSTNEAPRASGTAIEQPAAMLLLPDDDSVDHLLALGYREQPDEYLRIAIEQLQQQRMWNLAEAWSDAEQYDRAARVLQRLTESEPSSIAFRSALAEASFRAGQFDDCRRLILELQADRVWTPLSETGLAAIAAREGDAAVAVDHLLRAEKLAGATAAVLELMGRLYLQLRKTSDAARLFDAAIAEDPSLMTAHLGRAITYLVEGDPFGAERHAEQAVSLNPQSYEARYHLGLALDRQHRSDEAIQVFRAAVELDHHGRSAAAHRRLADLLERRGDHAIALYHRAQSYH